MRWWSVFSLPCLLLAGILTAQPAAGADEPYRWRDVDRVVVIPDVHGAYPALVRLLQATHIVDESLRWTGGQAHLVSLGDLLDRGPQSRQTMDLLMRLQSESVVAGGRVHVVAGNHELMNLIGDLRYVSADEFAAFAADETQAMRTTGPAAQTNQPPGYYAHRKAFRADGHYGRWLLSLPAVIVINDTAYAHGGLPRIVAQMDLATLNESYRQTVVDYLSQWRRLVASGVLPDDESQDAGLLAESILEQATGSDCLQERAATCVKSEDAAALRDFVSLSQSPLMGPQGPLWYRGAAWCRALFERPILDASLATIGASSLVVGHTTSPDRQVHALHDGTMTLLDTGMLVKYYKGRPAALVVEDDRHQVQYLDPDEIGRPVHDAYPGAYKLARPALLEALGNGSIRVLEKPVAGEPWSVEVSHNGTALPARFYPSGRNSTADAELAAFALDQLLRFELVPPTIERSIDGTDGALQLVYDDAISERARASTGRHFGGWCSMNRQFALMRAWDALTANKGRSADNVFYRTSRWQLQLGEHGAAFGNSKRLPKTLTADALTFAPPVRAALAGLTEQDLMAALGGRLSKKNIRALLSRRDAMLKLFGR